jgi:serine/threonine protein kinase
MDMELTVQNVYGLLLRSKLMPFEEARSMYERWQTEARDAAGNLVRFASWMVARGYLTEYQAQTLARGHADGFFLNEYKILDRLGKGRMAGVYRAQHHLGQVVAIKVLPPSKAKEGNMLGRFQREARLAQKLKHPNIVRTFQVGRAGELNYLVMEYLDGETLEDVLVRRTRLPPAEGVRLIYQALQGLQHIHSHNLVHRDLKPANMMLVGSTPDSTLKATLKILDIGLGRTLLEEAQTESSLEQGLTGEGVLLGTPDYMAPEQARDARSSDIRADIYSLGCVLYHTLTGQPPFPDTNIISQMIRHATETPRPARELNPATPDGLQQILGWMLAKDPAQRYPTPERAAQALQVFLAAGGVAPASLEADPKMRTYLNWLEGRESKDSEPSPSTTAPDLGNPAGGSRRPGSSGAVPARPAVAAPPVTAEAKKKVRAPKSPEALRAAEKRRARKEKKRRARAAAPPPLPGAAPLAPPALPAPGIDVELVPQTLDKAPRHRRPSGLSRREIVVFGVGVGAGALAAAVGCFIALRNRGQ